MPEGDYSAEARGIAAAARPLTQGAIARALNALGVASGDILLVHSSLRALGWVAGGAHAVVLALRDAIGPHGTLAMPTHSSHLSDPGKWRAPPVPADWWPIIRAETPAFDAALTPTRNMGAIVEAFRHVPGVLRSSHPLTSFAAAGPQAAAIVADHRLGSGMGEHSPLARLYERNARVLLLGVGHGNNTSLHLAETRATFAGKQTHTEGAPVLQDGERRWITFDELVWNDDDFTTIGAAFGAASEERGGARGGERTGAVGVATARLMAMRALVDFGVLWMEANRQ
jgi:aminoglycoside 3-N-acetyltransferase